MYDPTLYIVPVANGQFVVAPFDGDTICDDLKTTAPIGLEATLEAIAETDVSIWRSADGADVSWRHGWAVTAEDLRAAAAGCGF